MALPKQPWWKQFDYNREMLLIQLFQLAIVAFLVITPLVSWHVDSFLTRLCVNMASTWYAPLMFSVAIVYWVFELFMNYRKAHAKQFDMEPMLDREEAEPRPQGKANWVPEFRSAYRKREYISIVVSTLMVSSIIMYYEIWVLFALVARHHINLMKGACNGITLSFSFLEKFYVAQFLKDLPFSSGDLISLYGKCTPDNEVFAAKVTTTLASSLHWFLILFLVGYIWGKQIKTWFFPEKKEA